MHFPLEESCPLTMPEGIAADVANRSELSIPPPAMKLPPAEIQEARPPWADCAVAFV